jgi:hypothetical protein
MMDGAIHHVRTRNTLPSPARVSLCDYFHTWLRWASSQDQVEWWEGLCNRLSVGCLGSMRTVMTSVVTIR